MTGFNRKRQAEIRFDLSWESETGRHEEVYHADRVNLWRDCLPDVFIKKMMETDPNEAFCLSNTRDLGIPRVDPKKRMRIKTRQFNRNFLKNNMIEPRTGRFYPKGILKDVHGIYRVNSTPFRLVEQKNSHLEVDLNHPLAGKPVTLTAVVENPETSGVERGGTCTDWMEAITDGPGMQARAGKHPTDFFSDNPFSREDETPDSGFYDLPRMVNHVDETASHVIQGIYAEHLEPGMQVLDLMASVESHLPAIRFENVTGLGMNKEELMANTVLTEHIVHDLNENPVLPFADGSFDALICSLSVEYLTDPFAIFREAARVLKPGSPFIVTFSNRWFPKKATQIWSSLHEFERMGLVSEYFLESEMFENLHTRSVRGLPRPESDKYYGETFFSDPVYAVWATRK